jgi:hypothetical protein
MSDDTPFAVIKEITHEREDVGQTDKTVFDQQGSDICQA